MNSLLDSFINRCHMSALFFGIGLIALIFTGCGDASYSTSGEGGAVAFKLQWADGDGGIKSDSTDTIKNTTEPASQYYTATPWVCPSVVQKCDKSTITTVRVQIYNSQKQIVNQKDFSFGVRKGKFDDVQPGKMMLVVLGINSLGNPYCSVLQRQERGIEVVAGQTADAGTIKMNVFVPTYTNPSYIYDTDPYETTNTLRWNPVDGAVRYRIQVSTKENINNSILDKEVPKPSIEISFDPSSPLKEHGEYSWHVTAIDDYKNESAWSDDNYFKAGWHGTSCP